MPLAEKEQQLAQWQAAGLAHAQAREDMADAETEIDLIELFHFLFEKIRWILLAAVVAAVVAGIYTFYFQTPMFEATSKLYVANSRDSAINLSDLQVGTFLTKDYQEVFSTWEVHEMVSENLGLEYTYREMQDMLSISNPKDTRILYITIRSPRATEAATLANEYASVAKTFIYDTMSTEEPKILSVALIPARPYSPNKSRTVMLGFVLGGLLMAGVFVARFLLDDKIKTPDDIMKYTGLVTLTVVPGMRVNKTEAKGANDNRKSSALPNGQLRGRK